MYNKGRDFFIVFTVSYGAFDFCNIILITTPNKKKKNHYRSNPQTDSHTSKLDNNFVVSSLCNEWAMTVSLKKKKNITNGMLYVCK